MKELFDPKSVAVIGASKDVNSVGYGLLKSLVSGGVLHSEWRRPFAGKIYAVNPKADWVLNLKCYKTVKDISDSIDLAIIAVPAAVVPKVLNDCGKKDVKYAIIISSGFSESGEEGKKLQKQVLKIARQNNVKLVGPNCLGIIIPPAKLNASFAPTMPPQGTVAFITQSGALADSVIDWSISERYGFSAIVSLGNQADLDISDFIEYLSTDENTKAIALYVESIPDGRKFLETAKKVSKIKPIVVLKSGREEKSALAAVSHTGNITTSYKIYKTAFKQAGIFIADTTEELFDVAKALASQAPCKNNVAIVTNGGGAGVLCTDYCIDEGINLPELKKATIQKLDKTGRMHPAYSRANPLDLVGDALPDRYKFATNIILEENYINGLVVIQTLQTMTDAIEDARIIIDMHRKFPEKPIVCCFMGGYFTQKAINLLNANNIPNYSDPRRAARAMSALIQRYAYEKAN